MIVLKNLEARVLIPAMFSIAILNTIVKAGIIYVDTDVRGANDGSSWSDAYWTLHNALQESTQGDEIRIAQGIYKPDQTTIKVRRDTVVTASGDRQATFQLKNGVVLKGGYAGSGEPDPDVRDIDLYQSILSGDLNGDDGPDFSNYTENSYHVVTGSGTNATAVLDGFTVSGGNANETIGGYGGGMHNDLCTTTVTNCNFNRNSATRGGGMANTGRPKIPSGPTLTNCAFSGNSARLGGGMANWGGSSGTLTNCTFSGNTAENGGAMFITKVSEATLRNCTLTGNQTSDGDGGAIACTGNSSATLVNTILWNNSTVEIYLRGSSFTVTYSDVQGGWPGVGNIDADPLFVDADGADNVIGTGDDNLRLFHGSPCIDAGDNSAILPRLAPVVSDLYGNPRIINGTVDMGAYEGGIAPPPSIYYVDAVNGDNNNNGLRPKTAFASIQKGIDSAEDGDTVLVYSGLYLGEINFVGKALTVQGVASTAGVPVLQNPGDFAVSFYNGEGPDSVLKNFIIRNSFMGIFIAGSSPTMSNVTVVDNKYGIEAYVNSEPNISNGIFWNNTESDLFGCQARYSCIERGSEGEGNIAADPCFVDPADGDYHLLSERGRYWPEHDVWVLDKVTSPCINGGDPNADASDEPMPNGGRINMGAYAGTAYASMSALNQPPHVRITVPEDGIATSGPLSIEVNAWDRDGYVVKVEFFADGGKIGEDNDINDGWKMAWLDWTEGMHSLSAMATDNDGVVTISPAIEITMLRQQRRR